MPAPSFESAAFEATDQVADGPPPWLDRLATSGSSTWSQACCGKASTDWRAARGRGRRSQVRGPLVGDRRGRLRGLLRGPPRDRAGPQPTGRSGAVARCWASLWSPAAIAYRRRRGLPANDVAMAVVVQGLVPADAAAVAFTRHPVTGREDQVDQPCAGSGDAMVAGTVTPDTRRRQGVAVDHRVRARRGSGRAGARRQIWPRSWTSPSGRGVRVRGTGGHRGRAVRGHLVLLQARPTARQRHERRTHGRPGTGRVVPRERRVPGHLRRSLRGRGVLGARRHAHAVCADPIRPGHVPARDRRGLHPLLRDVRGAAAAAPEAVARLRLFRVRRTSRTSARRSRTWWTQVNRDRISATRRSGTTRSA